MSTAVLGSEQAGPPSTDGQLLDVAADLSHLTDHLVELESGAMLRVEPKLLGSEHTREGEIQRYGFVTVDGFAHDALVGIPKDQQTDIPILGTSAWLTSSHGHNEHFLRHLMRAGSPIIFVGSEGSYRPNHYPGPHRGITLAGSAAATLSFAREVSDQSQRIDKQRRIVIGESRGAMVAMGMLAMDELFDQEVVYADLTAPCFPRRPELSDAMKLSGHIIKEPLSFWRVVNHLTLSQVQHYPATLDLHPYGLAHQVAMGPALFSGEAGDLARLIRADKTIHITCFNDDFASMPDEWREIFADHPNVRVTILGGSHLTIADPETLAYIEARNQAFHEVYDPELGLVYGQEIFDRAHKLIETTQ